MDEMSIEEKVIKIGKEFFGEKAEIVVKFLGSNVSQFEILYKVDGLTAGLVAGVNELSSEDYENNIKNIMRNLSESIDITRRSERRSALIEMTKLGQENE